LIIAETAGKIVGEEKTKVKEQCHLAGGLSKGERSQETRMLKDLKDLGGYFRKVMLNISVNSYCSGNRSGLALLSLRTSVHY
jgi:hypothetical protein